jgi:ABC-type Fe3+ transport system permease subunit
MNSEARKFFIQRGHREDLAILRRDRSVGPFLENRRPAGTIKPDHYSKGVLMFASSYPLLDIFFTMLWFFLFVMWIVLLISIIGDVFRSHDMGGFAKFLWLVFIIFLPFLGVLLYVLIRGGSMHERSVQRAQQQEQAVNDYIRQTAGGSSAATDLATLSKLHDDGKISDADFEKGKTKILG